MRAYARGRTMAWHKLIQQMHWQRQMARRVLVRHSLIMRTDSGVRLLRALSRDRSMPILVPASAGMPDPVTMGDTPQNVAPVSPVAVELPGSTGEPVPASSAEPYRVTQQAPTPFRHTATPPEPSSAATPAVATSRQTAAPGAPADSVPHTGEPPLGADEDRIVDDAAALTDPGTGESSAPPPAETRATTPTYRAPAGPDEPPSLPWPPTAPTIRDISDAPAIAQDQAAFPASDAADDAADAPAPPVPPGAGPAAAASAGAADTAAEHIPAPARPTEQMQPLSASDQADVQPVAEPRPPRRPLSERVQEVSGDAGTARTLPPAAPAGAPEPPRSGTRGSTPASAPRNADNIFRPRPELERTPQEWARLLTGASSDPAERRPPAARVPPHPPARANAVSQSMPATARASRQPAVSAASVQERPAATAAADRISMPVPDPLSPAPPAPLREATRRFLRPLVGINPSGVRVHRGERAGRVAAALAADAVTTDTEVLLGTQAEEQAPETLGLLAHELTHVARRHVPRFVPPLVRDVRPLPGDEEDLARLVEARTVQLAGEQHQQHAVSSQVTPASPASPAQGATDAISSEPAATAAVPHPWGNLPAPWEPLPTWVTEPATPTADTTPSSPPDVAPAQSHGTAAASAAPAVQRAAVDRPRAMDLASAEMSDEPAPAAEQAAEPDLDALARQVYAVLKRRLDGERRRQG